MEKKNLGFSILEVLIAATIGILLSISVLVTTVYLSKASSRLSLFSYEMLSFDIFSQLIQQDISFSGRTADNILFISSDNHSIIFQKITPNSSGYIIDSSGNVSWGDGTTIGHYIRYIYKANDRCILRQRGTYSPSTDIFNVIESKKVVDNVNSFIVRGFNASMTSEVYYKPYVLRIDVAKDFSKSLGIVLTKNIFLHIEN